MQITLAETASLAPLQTVSGIELNLQRLKLPKLKLDVSNKILLLFLIS